MKYVVGLVCHNYVKLPDMETVTYLAPERRPQFWHFVGECGLERKGNHVINVTNSTEEYVFWLQLGVTFLRHIFGVPPSDWVLDILWAQPPHGEGKFPIIAVGFNDEEESTSAEAYARKLDKALQVFNNAVDWRAIARVPLPDVIG